MSGYRRVVVVSSRELRCTYGHRAKHQPSLFNFYGDGCNYTHPPHGPRCNTLTLYVAGDDGKTLSVEVTGSEMREIRERFLNDPKGALTHLSVELPDGFTVAAA